MNEKKKTLSLSFKLIGGFAIVALITGIIGFMGIVASTTASSNYLKTTKQIMPAMNYLKEIEYSYSEVRGIIRTMQNPIYNLNLIRTNYSQLKTYMEDIKETKEKYNKLPKVAEEEKLWKEALDFEKSIVTLIEEMTNQGSGFLNDGVDQTKLTQQLYDLNTNMGGAKKFGDMQAALLKLEDFIQKYYAEDQVATQTKINTFLNSALVALSLIGFILSLGLGIFLARSITKPINVVSKDLNDGSRALESASYQTSSASQELSSGASELASSIEEITSSLEELQSVVESNTKNVNQSELMMKETTDSAREVTNKMKDMQSALSEINENSKKIVKIIKVIDDIAFQTNILALNAAVEAARAGDAGRGFAVVADQVKNLAQKSAEAAKETAELIEKAIDSVTNGESLGKVVMDVQLKAGDMAEKVSTLLDEVNRASKEQMKGINQITQAVSQTNTVVQQTASSAEEIAASGEELLGQAESMNNIVMELNYIVKGKVESQKHDSLKPVIDKQNVKQISEISYNQTNKPVVSRMKAETVNAEQKIPLEDFSEF
jgi:methyl-accepting chemotaxis protein